MITIWWLARQASDVPEDDTWLSPSERDVLSKYWAPKRRRDWRLGRWTAKEALLGAGILSGSSASDRARLTIRANDAGVPIVFVDETASQWVVSLSHTGEHGLCAVANGPVAIGCDVETIGRRGEEFVIDWFTAAERAIADSLQGAARSRAVTLVWSAKESAMKALGTGLRIDTRDVEVAMAPDVLGENQATGWRPIAVQAPGRRFPGWWQSDGERMLSIVSDPPAAVPIELPSGGSGL